MRKPGALLTAFSISSAPRGTFAIFSRASLSGRPPRFSSSTAVGWSTSSTTEGARDAFGSDVVMSRADAAGREYVGVFGAAFVDVVHDRRCFVAHDASFLELDAELRELETEELQVGILSLAGQYLVADDQNAGGNGRRAAHSSLNCASTG